MTWTLNFTGFKTDSVIKTFLSPHDLGHEESDEACLNANGHSQLVPQPASKVSTDHKLVYTYAMLAGHWFLLAIF
jgi:hypothetical protein